MGPKRPNSMYSPSQKTKIKKLNKKFKKILSLIWIQDLFDDLRNKSKSKAMLPSCLWGKQLVVEQVFFVFFFGECNVLLH